MDALWIWILLGFGIAVLVAALVLGTSRRDRGSFWPWLDTSRGDRRLETHVAEGELKRTASQRDRDLAP